jgi:uncharacterized protein YcfL
MRIVLLAALLLCACRKEEPAAPTAEQSAQLNDAEDMLNLMASNDTTSEANTSTPASRKH